MFSETFFNKLIWDQENNLVIIEILLYHKLQELGPAEQPCYNTVLLH